MYLVIAKASLKADKEVFKKHFAKSICSDMLNEQVSNV